MKTKTKKVAPKNFKLKKFELRGTVVLLDGKEIGEYINDEFRPNGHGESLGFVWMVAVKGRDMLTYLIRQQDAIKNPPKKIFFKKKGNDDA